MDYQSDSIYHSVNMELIKTFISPDDIAAITCPKCSKARKISVTKYRHKRHKLKIRCSCHYVFGVLLDFRKHYRKETNLQGTYKMIAPAVGAGRLNILNISRNGVGFSIGISLDGAYAITPGQKMSISFQLDNKKQTSIQKLVTVRNVNDIYIGAEFHADSAFEKDLGFYLRP